MNLLIPDIDIMVVMRSKSANLVSSSAGQDKYCSISIDTISKLKVEFA